MLAAVIIAAAALISSMFVVYGDRAERDALQRTAEATAAALDPRPVSALHGHAEDSDHPAFSEVRTTLGRIKAAHHNGRFVYLLTHTEAGVVFLADAEEMDSADYTPPGFIYEDATPELRHAVMSGTSLVEGPASDQWGTWVTGIAPIRDPESGRPIAALGIDIDASDWQAALDTYRWIGLGISALLAAVAIVAIALAITRRRALNDAFMARRIIEASPVILYRLSAGPNPKAIYISESIRRLGYTPDEFIGSTVMFEIIHPDEREDAISGLAHATGAESREEAFRCRILARDGTFHWFAGSQRPIRNANGEVTALEGVLVDISEKMQAEHEQRVANTILETVSETSPDGILVVDAQNRIISFNRRFGEIWNIPADLLASADNQPVLRTALRSMKNQKVALARIRYLYAHQEMSARDEIETVDGRFFDRHTAPLTNPDGTYLGRVWFFRDITERKEAEAQILWSARHDPLTNLPNRGLFMETVSRASAQAARHGRPFAILYVDLDHFKDVNDTLGHPVGDELIKAAAKRLESRIRAGDMVARFGGDEFAIMACDVNGPDGAASLAGSIIAVMSEPFRIGDNDIRCSASIGIALRTPGSGDAEVLLTQADVALYRAKAEERGSYRFFTDAMDIEVRGRVTMIAELRSALANGEFFLHYQPQVQIEGGEIVGVEALVRWRHPTRGVVSPGLFIPIAESSGLIHDLGRFVLNEACRQQRVWMDAGIAPPILAINLSGLQFRRPKELERDVLTTLATFGVPPNSVELELTETVLMEASREQHQVLSRMRDIGLRLAIDDFGTGYSSLSYLHRFPVDRIKIAQNFVAGIDTSPHSAAIVKATIGLAHDLHVDIIAEGVETREQLELLSAWGCHKVQGYYYARPMAPDALAPFLKAGRFDDPDAGDTRAASGTILHTPS